MKQAIIAWLITKVALPFAFWLDDAAHTLSTATLRESKEAKRAGMSLHQYRVTKRRSS